MRYRALAGSATIAAATIVVCRAAVALDGDGDSRARAATPTSLPARDVEVVHVAEP
ncbi:MAG: hypothetical protein ACRDMA_04020 [Solirubrobacterales bacterium]